MLPASQFTPLASDDQHQRYRSTSTHFELISEPTKSDFARWLQIVINFVNNFDVHYFSRTAWNLLPTSINFWNFEGFFISYKCNSNSEISKVMPSVFIHRLHAIQNVHSMQHTSRQKNVHYLISLSTCFVFFMHRIYILWCTIQLETYSICTSTSVQSCQPTIGSFMLPRNYCNTLCSNTSSATHCTLYVDWTLVWGCFLRYQKILRSKTHTTLYYTYTQATGTRLMKSNF